MNGISSATKIRNIQQEQGQTERPWLVFGRPQVETRLSMRSQN